jgi:hypothetical protein
MSKWYLKKLGYGIETVNNGLCTITIASPLASPFITCSLKTHVPTVWALMVPILRARVLPSTQPDGTIGGQHFVVWREGS